MIRACQDVHDAEGLFQVRIGPALFEMSRQRTTPVPIREAIDMVDVKRATKVREEE